MKKPLIAITPSHNTENDDISMRPTYLRAVAAAGGLPVVLPLEGTEEDIAQYVDTCDGFLFSGGPDLHPFLFGEDTHQNCGNVSAARDTMEQQLFKLAFKARKPILGICRGIQEINVFLGGDIYQDLPSQYEAAFPIAHRQPYYYTTTSHLVDIVPGTRMAEIAGGKAQIAVNSMHHQAVRSLAPGLTVSAVARDGLTEAVEMQDYPYLLAVQWHPEYLSGKDEAAGRLFASFVDACRVK
ncbi:MULTISPECIES: gamma-glutamyl-gamma-aminobutyrate hydrolase family protein [Enterocloster]|uniref:Putative glutamine amidotransferase n=1 Tax=Enterocloster lavalensis TaxID=460384 RepID=A0A1I0GVG9_9FIRM|nr:MULTISPECIES: gamma-glutamyl-gamma-aminobutyrate hydrolase family protein [Enterocloster]MBS5607706.1 gamma-glutamyl-gamma-aminobutyrate hydrolase family protein [Enterocloster asparagiformis]MCB6341355.1 gamma-glutamyl-gamma-aminobutyrate hydrolase family protein [Enterocloster lavalensis]MDR3756066.1 gamma-glutamyl-gamma-aminobutyrate hydrolase family protein [Enterocloster sp.]PST30667.1 gamma-glutamyl-gamma-aminobutyrate hydrolase family protein [Enterocloster lavalensis]SET74504.1 puta